MSTSSENASLNMPHKIDNGNRYKLVNDTIWIDTHHSNSNQSNPDCRIFRYLCNKTEPMVTIIDKQSKNNNSL
jgi:hypothetical protein